MWDFSCFKACPFFQSRGHLLPCRPASSYHCLVFLKLRLVFTPPKGFITTPPFIGVVLDSDHSSSSTIPDPLSHESSWWDFLFFYVQDWFWYCIYVQNLHRNTSSSSILVLLLEQVRTLGWAKARLGRRQLSSGNHLVYKAEYMGWSCHRQVWAITFDWSTLVTWNKPSWTAFWKPFSGIPLPPFMSPGREHLAPGNWGARCGHPAKTWQVSYPCKELSKCCSGRLISGR